MDASPNEFAPGAQFGNAWDDNHSPIPDKLMLDILSFLEWNWIIFNG